MPTGFNQDQWMNLKEHEATLEMSYGADRETIYSRMADSEYEKLKENIQFMSTSLMIIFASSIVLATDLGVAPYDKELNFFTIYFSSLLIGGLLVTGGLYINILHHYLHWFQWNILELSMLDPGRLQEFQLTHDVRSSLINVEYHMKAR